MTTTTIGTLTGRAYLRASIQKDVSIEGQHADNLRATAFHGITVADKAYVDNNRSASAYATKVREGYEELIFDLTNGRFDDDLLVLWESSRGSRKTGEWVLLIDVLAEQGKRVFVTTHDRILDPANWRDRKALLSDAIESEAEIGLKRERSMRGIGVAMNAGKMLGGPAPFGYRKVRGDNGKVTGVELEPVEIAAVAEAFRWVRGGDTISSWATEAARRGIRSRSGKVMGPGTWRSILARPLYAALRPNRAGELIDADWPEGIDRETFYAVQRIISAPGRGTSKNAGRITHEFTSAVRCGVCGSPLGVLYARSEHGQYQCNGKRSCVTGIDKPTLDAIMREVIVTYLSRHADEWAAMGEQESVELRAARVEIERLNHELTELADRVVDGKVSVAFAERIENGLSQRLSAAESRVRELQTPSELRDMVGGSAGDVAARWEAAPIAARRRVAALVLSPTMVGQPVIMPKRGARNRVVPVADRIEWRKGA